MDFRPHSPPPYYKTGPASVGSRPPSYHTDAPSRPGSIWSGRLGVSQPPQAATTKGSEWFTKKSKIPILSKPVPLKPVIEEDEKLPHLPPLVQTQPTPRQKGRYILVLWIVIAFSILLAIIIPVIAVFVIKKSLPPITVVANSTATVYSLSTVKATSTATITSTASTTLVPVSASQISTSTSAARTIPLGGFDALEFTDQSIWMFYTDQQARIRHIASAYYSRLTWIAANPAIIASGVKPGSPVQVAATVDQYSKERTNAHVFYVDNSNTLQELRTQTPYSYGTGYFSSSYSSTSNPYLWTLGSLGGLNLKTSESMSLRVCLPWNTSRDYHDDPADLYLYYSSKEGGVKKLGWWDGPSARWERLTDLPQLNTRGFIECQNDLKSYENMWIVNDQHLLEQWTHISSENSTWIKGVQGIYPVYPETSLLSITSEVPSLGGRTHLFYQDEHYQIRRMEVNGRGARSIIAGDTVVGNGTPGTRLTTTNSNSGYCGRDYGISVYYQMYTSEIMQYTFIDTGTSVTSVSSAIPLSNVQTYGSKPKTHYSGGQIFGLVLAGLVCTGVLVCFCGICFH